MLQPEVVLISFWATEIVILSNNQLFKELFYDKNTLYEDCQTSDVCRQRATEKLGKLVPPGGQIEQDLKMAVKWLMMPLQTHATLPSSSSSIVVSTWIVLVRWRKKKELHGPGGAKTGGYVHVIRKVYSATITKRFITLAVGTTVSSS